MEVAAQHAEAVGQGSGIGVEERFLLNGVALHTTHITPGNVELTAAVEPDFAHTGLAVRDGAAVAAGEAPHAIAVELFIELALTDVFIKDVSKARHNSWLLGAPPVKRYSTPLVRPKATSPKGGGEDFRDF